MTNISFNSIKNAVSLEKTFNKGTKSLIGDFIADISATNAAAVKDALKKALKEAGFVPSNAYTMKTLNTAIAIAAGGIASNDAAAVMDFLKIKPAEGEKMTAKKIAAAVEKSGDIAAVVKAAQDAAQPEAKKAARKAAAKKAAATRVAGKSAIVPQAVRDAAIASDAMKAENPTQAATPAARLDRAVNCFLALDDDGRKAFVAAVRKELNDAIMTASKDKKKVA